MKGKSPPKSKTSKKSKAPLAIIGLLIVGVAVVLLLPTDGNGVDNTNGITLAPPWTWFAGEDESTWPTMSWLHTEDNRIVDENDNTVLLRGVAIADPWRFYNYEEELRPQVFQTIAEVWGANVIRVPIYPSHWEAHPALFSDYYDHVIRAAHKYGLYVILDWHGIGNVISGETTADGARWGCLTDLPTTETAWDYIAERYKDKSWVIYDLFNEPTDDSGRLTTLTWDDWKSVAENLIDIIRSHNSKALVMVSGYRHGSDLRPIPSNPVNRENIIYGGHVYPVVEWGLLKNNNENLVWQLLDEYIGIAAENYPVMMSEWGYLPYEHPDYLQLLGTKANFGDPVMNWLDNKNLTWTGWIWSVNWFPPMITGWYDFNYPPNEFGQLILDALSA